MVRSILNIRWWPSVCRQVLHLSSVLSLASTLAASESRVLSLLLALLLLLACVLLMLDWLLLSPEGGLSHPFGRHGDMAAGHYTPLSPSAPVMCSDSLPVPVPNNQGELSFVSNNLCYPLPRSSFAHKHSESDTLVTSQTLYTHDNVRKGYTQWKAQGLDVNHLKFTRFYFVTMKIHLAFS